MARRFFWLAGDVAKDGGIGQHQFSVLSSRFSVSGRRRSYELRTGNRELALPQVFFFQNPPVMQFVSGDDVGEGAYGDFIVTGCAASSPGRFVEVAEERNGGAADSDVVLDQVFD